MIHPTAIIHRGARLGPGCSVGAYALIDEHVVLGVDCIVGPHVHLTGHTSIGARNRFHTGCVIGDAPQDMKYTGAPTRLRIGDDNTFREHVTIHRSNRLDEATEIGHQNLLMASSHVGHNCTLGNGNTLANGALLAGHVILADRVFLSGNCLVHQFCRVGRLAMMQGGAAISQDLPPFCMARGDNGIAGLNVVGLRRAGFTPEQRLELKRAYLALFRSDLSRATAIENLSGQFEIGSPALELLEFVRTTKRGICADTGRRGRTDPSEA